MNEPHYTKGGHWRPSFPGKICATCGSEFTAHSKTQKYCSHKCVKKEKKVAHTIRTCPTCSKEWSSYPSNPSQFCSKACLHADYQKRKQRVCRVCGKDFQAPRAGRPALTCSPECLRLDNQRRGTGRVQSKDVVEKRISAMRATRAIPEVAARHKQATAAGIKRWHSDPENAEKFRERVSDRMKRRHTEPDFQKRRDARSSRVMLRNWELYRDHFTEHARENYARMVEQGTGIRSDEAEAKKRTAAKWILKRAQAALHTETEYDEVYAEVQARLRREMPYDGPQNESDYFDYLKKLGTAVVMSPECRSIADAFMSEAIPRFAAEWQKRKTGSETSN